MVFLVVIAAIDSELTCKCLGLINEQYHLLSGTALYPPIALAGKELHVWRIHTIHSLRGPEHS
ncbi:hypothetical protein J3U57_03965 [Gilliamella sp. B3464]|uniref:hypothetical protein n=1 Tax=unclassified Gilliamella TaxID=2685620 RepID=UPI00226A9B70|nr:MULTISPECIES: hypothetical protein [unclassified Gilliamella]MCX8711370.1 hypothetical protein [Gilliamella sp. B3468]MCX8750729.1 hypothetical protein [Gilliamella sp. B3464]